MGRDVLCAGWTPAVAADDVGCFLFFFAICETACCAPNGRTTVPFA